METPKPAATFGDDELREALIARLRATTNRKTLLQVAELLFPLQGTVIDLVRRTVDDAY